MTSFFQCGTYQQLSVLSAAFMLPNKDKNMFSTSCDVTVTLRLCPPTSVWGVQPQSLEQKVKLATT